MPKMCQVKVIALFHLEAMFLFVLSHQCFLMYVLEVWQTNYFFSHSCHKLMKLNIHLYLQKLISTQNIMFQVAVTNILLGRSHFTLAAISVLSYLLSLVYSLCVRHFSHLCQYLLKLHTHISISNADAYEVLRDIHKYFIFGSKNFK